MAPQVPLCPTCNAVMLKRKSLYGSFWGCSRYPDCDGMTKDDSMKLARMQRPTVSTMRISATSVVLDKFQEKIIYTRSGTKLVIAAAGCHAADEYIRMFDGSVKAAQDVVEGDELLGPDLRPRRVQRLHRGHGQMHAVIASDGYTMTVNSGHILTVCWPNTEWKDISVAAFKRLPYWTQRYAFLIRVDRFTSAISHWSFRIADLDSTDYYGWELDGDKRYLTVNGTVNHNSGKSTVLVEWMTKLLYVGEPLESMLVLVYGREAAFDVRSKWCARLSLPAPLHPDTPINLQLKQDKTTLAVADRAVTVHSWAYRQIKAFDTKKWTLEGNKGAPSLYNLAVSVSSQEDASGLMELYQYTTEALCDFKNADTLRASALSYGITVAVEEAKALIALRTRLVKDSILTFSDMLRIVCEWITVKAQQCRMMEADLRWLAVDEAQDSNRARLCIARFLSSKAKSTIVAADIRQSIFSFAGARPKELLEWIPEQQRLSMPVTRRCPSRVVDLANALCQDKWWNVGATTESRKNAPEGNINYVLNPQWRKELATLVRKQCGVGMSEMQRGGINQIAVLARTRRELALAECALLAAGIPVKWLSDMGGPWLTVWGKAIRGYLHLLYNAPTTSELVYQALSRPKQGVPLPTIKKVLASRNGVPFDTIYPELKCELFLKELIRIRKLPWLDQIADIKSRLTVSVIKGRPLADLSTSNLEALDVIEALTDAAIELKSWRNIEQNLAAAMSYKDSDPAVVLATIHKSKGLEYRHVHIAGCDNHNFPHYKSTTPEQLDEEERILYVAVTRTSESLTFYAAKEFSKLLPTEY